MMLIIESYRYAFPSAGTVDLLQLAYALGFMAVILLIGLLIFYQVECTFMDTV